MILTPPEIQQVLQQVKAAFPKLTDWQYNNEKNDEYLGFSVWGEFVLDSEDEMRSQSFFITLDLYEDKWQGYLTSGLPCYFWSSTDLDDAHLLNTESCDSLDEAIAALKAKIVELLGAFVTDL